MNMHISAHFWSKVHNIYIYVYIYVYIYIIVKTTHNTRNPISINFIPSFRVKFTFVLYFENFLLFYSTELI